MIYILVDTMCCSHDPAVVDNRSSTVSMRTGLKDPPSRTELSI